MSTSHKKNWLSLAGESFGLPLWTLQKPYCPLWHCWLSMYQARGLFPFCCCNESWIPTTNVLNYDFVAYCLIGWASNNTELGISHLGHSPVPMLPFWITDSPHIKGTQRRSLWSKQTTNKHMKQPITGAQLQWEELISKVRKMVCKRLVDWDMKSGIVLPTFVTARFDMETVYEFQAFLFSKLNWLSHPHIVKPTGMMPLWVSG